MFFFLLEEDSDEIKIGTSCKNGGVFKGIYYKICVISGSKIFILRKVLLTQLDTNVYVPVSVGHYSMGRTVRMGGGLS